MIIILEQFWSPKKKSFPGKIMQLLEFSAKHLKGNDVIKKLNTDLPGHIMLDQADYLLYWYDWFFAWKESGECDAFMRFWTSCPPAFSL